MTSRSSRAAHILIGCAGLGLVQGAQAVAPPKTPVINDESEASGVSQQDIVVTARHLRGSAATEVPPEVSLNSAVIQSLGAADLSEVFRELAPELGTAAVNASTPGSSPIVLVNGQRIAGFSSIKDFPPEAVSRIEIFPEKVALQYGYGADQRVVNVVLRESYRALTLLGRYTLAPDTWRGVYRAKVDLIRIGENSHWNVTLDYSHLESIFATSTLAGTPAPAGSVPVPRHTLASQDDHLTLSGLTNRTMGDVTAELTGSLDLDAIQSRPGLSQTDGDLLDQEGLPDLITGPVSRFDQTVHARTNLTLNGKFDGWRWSAIGRLDDSTRLTRTNSAYTGGDLATIMLPSPGLLGVRCSRSDAGCVSTNVRRAGGDFYLNGDLFRLPAGAVTAAIRTDFAFSGLRADSALETIARTRDEGSLQANVDVPLTGRGSGVGRLAVGINGEAHRVSDFGMLRTWGSTLDWSPIAPISFIASYSRAQQAPSLVQLGEATLITPNLREYDFVTDTTTIVQRIEGGNSSLVRATSDIAKARLQVTPLPSVDLSLSAEYSLDRTRDPVITLTAATAAAMAAFPTRFGRTNGYLTSIDVGPINAARRDSQQIRWGVNYSTAFGAPWPVKSGEPANRRSQFQIALYDTWHFQDDVVLATGQRRLNLIDGDVIGDDGGTPNHKLELQTSVSMRTVSADVSAVWQTPTTAKAGILSNDELTFSQGVTFNLRVQLPLANQHWLTRRIPWLRGTLNLSADNLFGAHTIVHDANGAVPLAYAQSYLNPTGRTFRITLRKRFH